MNMDRFKEPDRELSHHEKDPEQRKEKCWKCKGTGWSDYDLTKPWALPSVPCPVCFGIGAIDL